MQINISTLKFMLPSALIGLLLLSCGTHNQNDYSDADGIYNSDTQMATEVVDEGPSDSYYKQYFNSKTEAYEDLPEEGAIFTDVDAYSTSEYMDEDGYVVVEEREAEENYGGWGENANNVTVNVYGGNNYGYWNRPYWWYGSGYGYYNYWASPYYGVGWGWGYPFYGYYGYGYPSYYGGYYNNYYNPYYGNAYNGYSYTRGRRNSDYYNGRTAASRSNYNHRDARNGRSITRQTENARNNSSLTDRNSRFDRSTSPRTTRRSDYNTRSTAPRTFSRNTRPTSRGISRPSTTRRSTSRPTNTRSTRNSRPTINRGTSRPSTRGVSRPSRSSSPSTKSSSRGGSSRSSGTRGGSSRGGGSKRGGGRG